MAASEWRLPRHKDGIDAWISTVLNFIFLHYFFWAAWIVSTALAIMWLGLCSARTMTVFGILYALQLAIHKPQFPLGKAKGWSYHSFAYARWWDYILSYADATFVREQPLTEGGKYMFCFAPHGVLAVCRGATCGTTWQKMFPGIHGRWASFGAAFYIPGVREFSLLSGAIDASKKVLTAALARGESVFIIPGGSQELMLTDGGSKDTKLVLKNRKGFAKLAIEAGVDIVPVFCFGEKWCHDLVSLPEPLRSAFYQATKMVPMTVLGKYNTFLGKTQKADGTSISLGWVFGAPIKVQKMDPNSVDEAAFAKHLDAVHAAYCEAIGALFESHKTRFGYGDDETLSFVEAKAGGRSRSKGQKGKSK